MKTGETLQEMADVWKEKNPNVYAALASEAIKAAQGRHRHLSIDKLISDFRDDARYSDIYRLDEFKINNDVRAPLARMLMGEYPELDGCFETRRSKVSRFYDEMEVTR